MNAVVQGNIRDQKFFQDLSNTEWTLKIRLLFKNICFSPFSLQSHSNNKHNKEKHTMIYKELMKYDIYPAIILDLYIFLEHLT